VFWITLSCVGPKANPRTVPIEAPAPAVEAKASPRLPAWDSGAQGYGVRGPIPPLQLHWQWELYSAPTGLVPWQDGVALSTSEVLMSVDQAGQLLWKERRGQVDLGLVDGRLVALSEGELRRCGDPSCQTPDLVPLPAPLQGPPVAVGTAEVMLTRAGTLPQWALDLGSPPAANRVTDGLQIYIATEGGELVAAGPPGELWRSNLGGPGQSRPLYFQERAYAASAAHSVATGQLNCFDMEGALIWRHELDSGPIGGLAVWDEAVLVVDAKGVVQAFEWDTGALRWRTELSAGAVTDLSVAQGRGYLGLSDGTLRVLDLDDGGEWGRFELGAQLVLPPVVLEGLVVVALADKRVMALRAR
jgi:hypothetical protein